MRKPDRHSKYIPVLINSQAGGKNFFEDKILDRIRERGKKYGLHLDPQVLDLDRFESTLLELIAAKTNEIWVGGGDGSIRIAARLLIGKPIALGVLPMGTFNLFAKELNMPLDPVQTVDLLSSGRIQGIDVAWINDILFIHYASLGLHPLYALKREEFHERFKLPKKTSSSLAWFWAVWKAAKYSFTIKTKTETASIETPFVYVTVNEYENQPLSLTGRKSLTDGRLNIFYSKRAGRITVLKTIISAILGRLKEEPEIREILREELKIETPKKVIKAAVDGDLYELKPPLQLLSHPRGLKVVLTDKKNTE